MRNSRFSALPSAVRRTVVGALGAGVLVAVTWAGVALTVAETLTRPRRQAAAHAPAEAKLVHENVTFRSTGDGIELRGWFLPAAGSDRVVVIVHGRNSNRAGLRGQYVRHAAALVARGYNALLFDLRAHGESGGVRYTLGAAERRDVLGAAAWLQTRGFAAERTGFWAHSMGAAAVLLAAADTPDVRAIVADSGFARLEDLLDRELPRASGLPGLFNPAILFFTRTLFGADAAVVNPIEAVAGLPRGSLFVIHGEADGLVPVEHARRIAAAAGPAAHDLWIVPGARHDRVWEVVGDRYESRVLAFFDEKLPRQEGNRVP